MVEAIAIRLEAIARRLEAMATRVEAIAIRLEAIASRLEAIARFFESNKCCELLSALSSSCPLLKLPLRSLSVSWSL